MNLEQATQLAQSLNDTLAESLADAYVVYKVFTLWSIDYTKIYNVVLIPAGLNLAFDEADYSQQIAFVRVSLASQLGQPASYEAFVNNFTSNTTKDSELDNYLNK